MRRRSSSSRTYSSQDAIRTLGREIHARVSRIDVLINNAGGIFARRELSVDGIEKTWATNHLAPFLVDESPLGLGARGACRPDCHRHIGIARRHLRLQQSSGGAAVQLFRRVQPVETREVLFTYELARRLGHSTATANWVSPGPTATRFGNEMRGLPGLFPRVMKRIPFLFVSPEQGARTPIYAASAPELAGVSGRFFLRGRELRTRRITYDPDVAARLWTVSEELTHQAFL